MSDRITRPLAWMCMLAGLAVAVSCNNEQRTSPPDPPVEPQIDSLESTSETVHPGDSVQLAVVASPVEGSGSTSDEPDASSAQQGLNHDTGPLRDTTSGEPNDTGSELMDAGPPSVTDTSNESNETNGEDASGTEDDDTSEDGDTSESAPEPPSGNVPSGWTVSWSVDGEGWTINGDGSDAVLQAPDRYETTATIEVTVVTPDELEASGELSITTGSNTAPAIVNTTARPNPVEPGGEIQATLEASDPNGDELTYNWRVDDPWQVAETSGTEATIRAPDRDGVFADLQVEVSDGYGGQTASSIRLETRTNTPPNLSSVTASPPQVEPGGNLQLEASATDAESDDLSYTWTVPSDWTASSTSGEQIELTAPDTYGVTSTIRVTVEDARGASASGAVVVSTRENRGPSITSLTAEPSSVDRGGTIELTVGARDPDGGDLSYTWTVRDRQTWTLQNVNNAEAEVQSPDQPGVRTRVNVTVEDEGGQTATASTIVSTTPNRSPDITSVSPNPSEVEPGNTLQVLANASDPDGDSLSYNWSVSGNWTETGSNNGPPNELTLQAPDTYDDRQIVTLTVEDGFGGSATARTVVSTTVNRAPTLSALTANPQSVAPGGTVQVEAAASDPNGNSLSYDWTVPSGWSQSGSGASIELTAPGSYGEQGTVQVSIEDGNGKTASGSVLVQTDRNQSPVISGLSANPVVLNPNGTSTLQANASDPNGDNLSYSWDVPQGWSQQGSGNSIKVTAPNQTSTSATLTLTVSDDSGASSQSAVTIQTINNRSPVIDRLAATPNPVAPGGDVQLEAQVTDPDGDAIQYTWQLPNGWSKSGSGKTITATAPDTYSQSGTVQLLVSDGKAQASDRIQLQTKSNQPPTIDDLTADPNPVLQNAETTVSVSASDPLGDNLSYTWNVGDSNWSRSGSGESITLQAPNDGNSSTSVQVTVSDGNGATQTSSVTVSTQSCPSGKGNCDGNANNGCEVNINSDDNNCGACGNSCSNQKLCSGGTCRGNDVAYQCERQSNYIVFASNYNNRTLRSQQDVVDACKSYGYKALGTSDGFDQGWGNGNNSNMWLAVHCNNCYWYDGGYPWYRDYRNNGNSCTHVSGRAQRGKVLAGFVANESSSLNCATFDQRVDGNTRFGDNNSSESREPWYDYNNDPNCDRNNRSNVVYTGTPDYILCASNNRP